MPARAALIFLAVSLSLCGCAGLGKVQAWEKGNIAKRSMSFSRDPLEDHYTQHIYASKENSSGGYGVGGGGCGCN